MTDKKSFVLYDNYFNQLHFLTMEQRGELFTAIYEYRLFGEIQTELSQITQVVFSFIKDTLDRDADAYKRRCEANRENGKKGGRPPKRDSVPKTEKPKKADNENGNGNENENDIVIDNGNGNGNGNEKDDGFAPLSCAPHGSAGIRRLSETEKKDLISFGVPMAYIEEREKRAVDYGDIHGKRPSDVLLSWWRRDEGKQKRKPRAAPEEVTREIPKSYDLDEFFEAALARGMCELEAYHSDESS